MSPTIAKETKKERYSKWLPLFIKEWKLLGKPEIIVIGKGVYEELFKLIKKEPEKIEIEKKVSVIPHYSLGKGFEKRIGEKFLELERKKKAEKYEKQDIDTFVKEMKKLSYFSVERLKEKHLKNKKNIEDYLENYWKKSAKNALNANNKKVFAVYSFYFKKLEESKKAE